MPVSYENRSLAELFRAQLYLLFDCCRYSPVGICSLIAAKVAAMDDISGSLEKLGLYMVTVIVGLLVHALILLPLLFFIVVRRNPFRFLAGMRDAIVFAFGSASR